MKVPIDFTTSPVSMMVIVGVQRAGFHIGPAVTV